MPENDSLTDHAIERSRLAGEAYLEDYDPFFLPTDAARNEAEIQGRPFVSFANYDYLGLAGHPEIKSASIGAIEAFGVGALASRLVGGERSIHRPLERQLAEFVGVESVLTLVSGYLSNVSLIAHLMGSQDMILIDKLSHNSIVRGAKGSAATTIAFRHNDMEHLESVLRKKRKDYRHALIAVESLYSMDGDVTDLPRLVEIKKNYNAWLLVDEAHSIGVLGKEGRGLCEATGVNPAEVDLLVGTLSKTFVSCGGFIGGANPVIRWLRYTLPGFVFSVGLSPAIAASAQAALHLVQKEGWRIEKLRRNADLFVALAREAGLDTGPAIGRGVVPILFSTIAETVATSQYLMSSGYYVPPIIQIGVPRNRPRLRFFLSAAHTEEEIREVIRLIARRPQPGKRPSEPLMPATG